MMHKTLCAGILALLLLGTLATTVQATPEQDQQLIDAAMDGDLAKIKALISARADVNARDKAWGMTALMFAVGHGYTEIAKLLVEKGADVDARDKDGFTALMMAAWQGHAEIAKLLIDRGADVNAEANDGFTALMAAEKGGYTEIVKLLKAAGAKG
jgi:ankyrin repeat protein